jgi:hypothetical protein
MIGCDGAEHSPCEEHRGQRHDGVPVFGGIFVPMGVLVAVGGFGDKYHNLMHLVWGALALGVGFLGTTVARRFCIASGAFYLTLSALGLSIGNPAMNRLRLWNEPMPPRSRKLPLNAVP